MKIRLILIGKTTNQHLISLCDDYASRLSHYAPFDIDILPAVSQTRNLTQAQQAIAEGKTLLAQIRPTERLILLDEHGKSLSSQTFADWLNSSLLSSVSSLTFAIGGPYGFSPQVYARANDLISLSHMTFSHQMVRLIFLEQLYRAFTILKGQPYHHP